jgi:hypothetical protein
MCASRIVREGVSVTYGWSGEEAGNRTLVSMWGDATTEDGKDAESAKDAESGNDRGAELGSRPDVEGGGSNPEIGVGTRPQPPGPPPNPWERWGTSWLHIRKKFTERPLRADVPQYVEPT